MAFWGQIEVRLQQHLDKQRGEHKHLAHVQKLERYLAEHWHPDTTVTFEGFHMLYQMLWGQHDEEHVHVLLQYAQHQRELHEAESFEHETQQCREWMAKATKQGCRGLFCTLKKLN